MREVDPGDPREARIRCMASDSQIVRWHHTEGDKAAIRWALDEIERLKSELAAKAEPPEMPTATRDELGELVRWAWVRWAKVQPDPKPHWLVPWEELSESEREVDRQIGEVVAAHVAAGYAQATQLADMLQATVERMASAKAEPPRPAAIALCPWRQPDVSHGFEDREDARAFAATEDGPPFQLYSIDEWIWHPKTST